MVWFLAIQAYVTVSTVLTKTSVIVEIVTCFLSSYTDGVAFLDPFGHALVLVLPQ